MHLALEINNQAKSPIKKSLFDVVGKAALEEKSLELSRKNFSLSLALVSRTEIKRINRVWRKKDAVTDVLSFAEFKKLGEIKKNKAREIFLGEIILCYDDIKTYAKKNNLKIQAELAKVFAHGILHLLGFSHGQKMFALQDKLLTKLKK